MDDFRLIPNGVNGIEERVHITWHTMVASGLMTLSDFVRATSADAAKAFNIYPQKGLLAPGSDADIMILDPAMKCRANARCKLEFLSRQSACGTGFEIMI